MNCRHCKKFLKHIFLDLGSTPPSNAYLNKNDLSKPENNYPLKVYVCEKCWLVQTKDVVNKKIFFNNHYPYFSSTSSSWVQHAKKYVNKICNHQDSLVFLVVIHVQILMFHHVK